jgi:RsiW-degrading membrane proteinase PrsW (M82 family)
LVFVVVGLTTDKNEDTTTQNQSGTGGYALLGFYILVVALLMRGRLARMKLRREVMRRIYENRESEVATEDFLSAYNRDICCAEMSCCGCYANDVTYILDNSVEEELEDTPQPDFCTRLFQNLGSICCGACCQCWCQCCGMCAIGQEEREISALVPKDRQLVDYITFEPFVEYYTRIVELRQNASHSFQAHVRAISKLSKKLLFSLGIALLLLTVLALLRVDKQFEIGNMLVLVATLLQAFLILYFVHWRWNRFVLSLDAVIKFFASGFLLATSTAMVYEWVLSILVGIISYFVIVFDIIAESPEQQPNEDPKQYMIHYLHSHVWLFAVAVFVHAFVIAALCEELCKYFSFWMCAHPDLTSEADWNEISDADSEEQAGANGNAKSGGPNLIQTFAQDAKEREPTSMGTAITVAMVTTALGFACCENLLYVFGSASGESLGMEAKTLLLRSIFPVHPLAAAIQSIGVCRRDLEGDKSIGLGRIIFPAVLLHGTYDFVLMLIALLIGIRHVDDIFTNDDAFNPETQMPKIELTPADKILQFIGLAFGFVMVLVGFAYYVQQSCSQKARMAEMQVEGSRRNQDESELPLVV